MNGSKKEYLSAWQALILIMNFEIGSAVVVGIAVEAKQDAWIAIVIAIALGVLIVCGYSYLLSLAQGENLYSALNQGFGKWLGRAVTFLYTVYFLYLAARIIRDFCELVNIAILPYTPMEAIIFSFLIIMAYMVYKGIEVMGRTAEVFSPFALLFVLVISLLLWASGALHIDEFQPVLGDGIVPVLKAIFPELLTFPFGETISFLLVLPLLRNKKHARKVAVWGVMISGILLVVSAFVQIASLGYEARTRASFPLLSAAKNISIGDFFERVDALVVFVMMLGIVVKSSIFLFCGLKGIEHLTHRPYRHFTMPVSFLVALIAVLMSYNYAEHIEEGIKIVTMYVHVPMQFVVPTFLLGMLWMKKKRRAKNAS